jgi:hypothetical protein
MTDPTPNFRALCAVIIAELENWMDRTDHRPASSVELFDSARAALATPPPKPPEPVNWSKLTNQQVMKIAPVSMPLGLTGEEETAYCAGFRRCAQAIGSAIEPEPPEDDDRWPHL